MSALGSSVISKSAKKFAPKKAPARRTTDAHSPQTSTRSSFDKNLHSQTPQLQPVQPRATASPAPSLSIVVPAASEHIPTPAFTQLQHDDGPLHISIPSRETSVARRPSAQPLPLQGKNLDRRQVADQQSIVNQSHNAASARTAPNPPLASDVPSEEDLNILSRPADRSESSITDVPPAKRRKVAKKTEQTVAASQDPHRAGPDVALPSTEIGDAARGLAAAGSKLLNSEQLVRNRNRIPAAQKRKQQEEKKDAPASENMVSSMQKPPKSRRSVATPSFHVAGEEIENAGQNAQQQPSQAASGRKSKNPRVSTKAKGKRAMENAAAAVVEGVLQASSRDRKKGGKRSKRVETPDEAQHVRIDVAETKMSDLCKDGGTGQKSTADKIIRESERAAALKRKQQEAQRMMGQVDESTPQAGEVGESRIDRLDRERREREVEMGNIVPQQHIVNGEIVVDTSSLRIDRHAIAAVERNAEQLESVEEDEYTRKVNNGIGLKRDRSGGWNEGLVDLFYDGLRMFGTDFGMISKMFPGKTRHAIKLKFCREEKENGPRIQAALLGEVLPVELEEFQKMTGEEYEDPSVLEKDIEEDKKKLEEEQEQEKQAIEAARRERAEQAEAERLAAHGEESSSKENRRQRKRKGGKGKKSKEQGEKNEKAPQRTKARKAGMLQGIGDNTAKRSATEG